MLNKNSGLNSQRFFQPFFPAASPLLKVKFSQQAYWLALDNSLQKNILRDTTNFSSQRSAKSYPFDFYVPVYYLEHAGIFGMQGTEQIAYRKVFVPEFTTGKINQHTGNMVAVITSQLAELSAASAANQGKVDLISDLFLPSVFKITSDILGLPASSAQQIYYQVKRILYSGQPVVEKERAVAQVKEILVNLLASLPATLEESSRLLPGNMAILQAKLKTYPDYSIEKLADVLRFILIAGTEPLVAILGLTTYYVGTDSNFRQAINNFSGTNQRDLIQELVRYFSPADLVISRAAVRDMEIADQVIKQGEVVVLPNYFSNHDPKIFTEPHLFNPERTDLYKHMAFGYGMHRCIGAVLVAKEMEIFLPKILQLCAIGKLLAPERGVELKMENLIFGLRELNFYLPPK